MTKQEQVGGQHYRLAIEPIDFIVKNDLDFCQGNVIKYIVRHKNKNKAEDIRKAIQYCEFILKYEYGEVNGNSGVLKGSK